MNCKIWVQPKYDLRFMKTLVHCILMNLASSFCISFIDLMAHLCDESDDWIVKTSIVQAAPHGWNGLQKHLCFLTWLRCDAWFSLIDHSIKPKTPWKFARHIPYYMHAFSSPFSSPLKGHLVTDTTRVIDSLDYYSRYYHFGLSISPWAISNLFRVLLGM
jgi:hypothetical protein